MKRLLWVTHERTEQSLRKVFEVLTADVRTGIRFVCRDMRRPSLNVIAEQIPDPVHILDRFHIMRKMNVAIYEVRRQEVAQLRRDGYEPAFTKYRSCLLKRPENLTDNQSTRLVELLHYNLKSVRVHLLRGEFQRFWAYASPAWAGKFLESWGTQALRRRLARMKKLVKSQRRHKPQNLNWFPRSRRYLGRYWRGIQRQGGTDHQERVWLPNASGHRIRVASCDGEPTPARICPKILVERLF